MIPFHPLDPRFGTAPEGPDIRIGRTILKALSRRREPAPPFARQTEAERPFWGPNPDPAVTRIEDEFYGWGQRAMTGMLSAVLGKKIEPRTILKAGFMPVNARISGWGQVMDLFNTRKSPVDLMDGWSKVIDKLTAALTPPGSAEAAAQALALRTHLMFKVGQAMSEPMALPNWMQAMDIVDTSQAASMEWTKARGLEYANNLSASMRHTLVQELVASKQADEAPGILERRLLTQFGQLNRDWRRIALTESAFAVQNGALASVNPDDGWIAIWIAAPTACPYCLAQAKKQFKVVAADAPQKDGDSQVWAGKSNWGRSAHKWSQKEGHFRTKTEMYWPCCPAHPNCACHLSLRPAKFAKHLSTYANKVTAPKGA
jgi:hypothetical protein